MATAAFRNEPFKLKISKVGVMKPLSGRTRESLQSGAMWRDKRGVSAVEFALLAPIIILMYVGTVEIGNLLTVDAARRDCQPQLRLI